MSASGAASLATGGQVLAHAGVDFCRCDEQLGLARGRHDREGERHRIVCDVAAADVEQPGDRIGQRQDDRVLLVGGELLLQLGQLVGGRDAGELQGLDDDCAGGRWRALRAPGCVDGVARYRLQPNALVGQRLLQPLDLCQRVQPGIEADDGALAAMLHEPVRRLLIRHQQDLETAEVGLLAHLQGVAAVDEKGRRPGANDRGAGRAGEAGQPGQPLGGRRHVLALVLVGAGHEEGVELQALQRGPEQRYARGDEGCSLGAVEVLEHAVSWLPIHIPATARCGCAGKRPASRQLAAPSHASNALPQCSMKSTAVAKDAVSSLFNTVGCRSSTADQQYKKSSRIMSNNAQILAAPAVRDNVDSSLSSGVAAWFTSIAARVRAAISLRQSLAEIRQLGDRELSDIGLSHDEIDRLRRNSVFLPDAWRETSVTRGELPF